VPQALPADAHSFRPASHPAAAPVPPQAAPPLATPTIATKGLTAPATAGRH
jgi:hypothetical protein